MIRRDYILRMIEEFIRALAGIRESRQQASWDESRGRLDDAFQRLVGTSSSTVVQLSDVDILALLAKGEGSLAVQDKALMLAALLVEAADVEAAQGRTVEATARRMKALRLLLTFAAKGDPAEFPAYVPRLETLVASLGHASPPAETLAMLMQYYERLGEFGRAEDIIHRILEENPADPDLVEFALDFYRRLARNSDRDLEAGNLPRAELEEGLAELESRRR